MSPYVKDLDLLRGHLIVYLRHFIIEVHGQETQTHQRRTPRKTTLEDRRQAPQEHRCRRVQAYCAGPDLPQVYQ